MEDAGGKPRVMVDANVLFAATLWPRWPYEVIQHAARGDFQLVLAPVVIAQARGAIAPRFPRDMERFETLLQLSRFKLVPDPPASQVGRNRGLVRDVTDVPVALAAINAGVDCLVSEDKDLTIRDATTTRLHKRLTVLLTGTFLRERMGWTSEELERVRGRAWQDLRPQAES